MSFSLFCKDCLMNLRVLFGYSCICLVWFCQFIFVSSSEVLDVTFVVMYSLSCNMHAVCSGMLGISLLQI